MGSKVCAAVALTASVAVHSVPGLGEVAITTQLDDRMRFELPGTGFHAARSVGPRGDLEIVVSGGGELIALAVRYEGRDRLSVRRGATVVSGVSNLSALRTLTDGRAVATFREHVGEFERRLLFDATAIGADDPHGHGFLLAGAFVAALAGDPTAVARARDIVTRVASTRRESSGRTDACLGTYNNRLLTAEQSASVCLATADRDESWYERSGQRLLCDATFTSAAATAEVSFAVCRAQGAPTAEFSPSGISEARGRF